VAEVAVSTAPSGMGMAEPRSEDTLDVTDFTVGAMLRTGLAIRKLLKRAESLEEAANLVVRLLYDRSRLRATDERSAVLVRFYKTHRYSELDASLQSFADRILGDVPIDDDLRCLTLL